MSRRISNFYWNNAGKYSKIIMTIMKTQTTDQITLIFLRCFGLNIIKGYTF